jgi:quinol monooxygenase YgiN
MFPVSSYISRIIPLTSSSRYKDKKALKEHGESASFQKFQQDLAKQDLLLAPPTIHVLSQRGGFSSRL